ncbi:transcription termination factor 1, mitochondrial [Centropristis striata]|uniref:transcription termination factor 1, mitochondrial n=1 Tax=Centropristis striata TaxID=184440 RepID=UPI0027DF7A39|nr:transcription termination factor 1, mitochondrial [Centropristis striata]
MAALSGVRALLSLSRSVTLQRSFGLIPVQFTSICLHRRLYRTPVVNEESKPPENTENGCLLENLNLMGVDVKKARQRQPGVFRKILPNQQDFAQFLRNKGASHKVIAAIISRFPRVITRSIDHLEQRWGLWRNIFETDAEIVTVLDRSPESFFRSSDNVNLEKNITFLISLGLETKHLHRLMTTAPRTCSKNVEHLKEVVELLTDICLEHGGKDPEQFVKAVITRNVYILNRSTKTIKTNIDFLKVSLKLSNSELLALLQGPDADKLDLSSEYLKRSFIALEQKMVSLGQKAELKKVIFSYPMVLFIKSEKLSLKLDCLLEGGITVQQILDSPRVLEYSAKTIAERLEELKKVGYDFQESGIKILYTSRKRFDAKIRKKD